MEISSYNILTNKGELLPNLCSSSPVRLTVWCKSLLFHGDGYTVFNDSDGHIVFRVDNYAHGRWNNNEMVLMGPRGHVHLTIRHCKKILSFTESWEIYKGDRDNHSSRLLKEPFLRVTKDLCNSTCTASMASAIAGNERSGFRLSWSRCDEWSKIHRLASDEQLVAEINRKFSNSKKILLGEDVLTITVQPGMDQAIVMALFMITKFMR
ncbi:Protein LURP-one-related 3 [Carex littledalei]|uniref:Protein LURP-one-related 3 n=1 Tax=Carex littledalei TaxID=544730 RepID=A0A833QSL8_9POAL|nr:Protein LURP-one-related 3 [Carex littledalei]